VFEQHPWRVGEAWRFLSAQFERDSVNDLVKFDVGVAAFEQVK